MENFSNYRGENKKKKFKFGEKKDCCMKSLKEVNFFYAI